MFLRASTNFSVTLASPSTAVLWSYHTSRAASKFVLDPADSPVSFAERIMGRIGWSVGGLRLAKGNGRGAVFWCNANMGIPEPKPITFFSTANRAFSSSTSPLQAVLSKGQVNSVASSPPPPKFLVMNNRVRRFSSQTIPENTPTQATSSNCTFTIKGGLETREAAADFLCQLSDHQKQLIYHTLNIEILRDKYEGNLGSSRQESHSYLSKFGRPATAGPDPTGTLCEVSPKWLHARLDEKAPPAPMSAVWGVALKNALPFVGFGFLDNLIMILAGDYIDITIGAALGISTMAAAALGNAISDMAGIGSAWYVEELAQKIGIRDPDLTPSQMSSWSIRWACNLGRAFGVTIGCLLGMFPLLFLPGKSEESKEKRKSKATE